MSLFLELSRNCNMSCSHCLRGELQNKYMSGHILRTTLHKLDADDLGIGGGEPLSSSKLMKTLRNALLQARVSPSYLWIVTNGIGLMRVPKIIKAVAALPISEISLAVSVDEYHDADSDTRHFNVKGLTEPYNNITACKHGADSRSIVGMGKAASWGTEITIEPEEDMTYVDIYGYVWPSCDLSYNFMDTNRATPICLGNVLTDTEEQIKEKRNILIELVDEQLDGKLEVLEHWTSFVELENKVQVFN